MCRTLHALLQTVICGIQMLVRVFMTVILMIENVVRMILQTLYNFISFLLQMISLLPICLVFMLTARLKCFMCGGGGPCPVARGGTCDCLMSGLAFIILFFIFRATGVLDKIFYSLGYTKAKPTVMRFVPTPGDITECSRNDSDVETESIVTKRETITSTTIMSTDTTVTEEILYYDSEDEESTTDDYYWYYYLRGKDKNKVKGRLKGNKDIRRRLKPKTNKKPFKTSSTRKWTTVVYYLV